MTRWWTSVGVSVMVVDGHPELMTPTGGASVAQRETNAAHAAAAASRVSTPRPSQPRVAMCPANDGQERRACR
jgi:hypothetical protein